MSEHDLITAIISSFRAGRKDDHMCMHGLDELMGIIKNVYKKEIEERENTAFFKNFCVKPTNQAICVQFSTNEKNSLAYLLDDADLEYSRTPGHIGLGDFSLNVSLSMFRGWRHTDHVVVRGHSVVGSTRLNGSVEYITFKHPADTNKDWLDHYFSGKFHLAYFVDSHFALAMKNICAVSWKEAKLCPDMLCLVEAKFLFSNFINVPNANNDVLPTSFVLPTSLPEHADKHTDLLK
jgi:hypothetical protein